MIYCNNDPCETEATHIVEWPDGGVTALCRTCCQAFQLGSQYERVADNDWNVWAVDNYTDHIRDIAHDMDVLITKGEAAYIISHAWAYDDIDEAVIQVTRQIRDDEDNRYADWLYDESRGT